MCVRGAAVTVSSMAMSVVVLVQHHAHTRRGEGEGGEGGEEGEEKVREWTITNQYSRPMEQFRVLFMTHKTLTKTPTVAVMSMMLALMV